MALLWIGGIQPRVDIREPYDPRGPRPVRQTRAATGVGEGESVVAQRLREAYVGEQQSRSRQPAVQTDQLMSREIHALKPDQSLDEAWLLLRVHRIRHAPVLDEEKRLVGLISDRDLLRADRERQKTVADIMTTRVLAAAPETPIREAAGTMADRRIHCLPVVDEQSRLIGMLTVTDILRCIVNQAPLDLWT